MKIYWAWLFLKLTSAALPMGIPLFSMSMTSKRPGSGPVVSTGTQVNRYPMHE